MRAQGSPHRRPDRGGRSVLSVRPPLLAAHARSASNASEGWVSCVERRCVASKMMCLHSLLENMMHEHGGWCLAPLRHDQHPTSDEVIEGTFSDRADCDASVAPCALEPLHTHTHELSHTRTAWMRGAETCLPSTAMHWRRCTTCVWSIGAALQQRPRVECEDLFVHVTGTYNNCGARVGQVPR